MVSPIYHRGYIEDFQRSRIDYDSFEDLVYSSFPSHITVHVGGREDVLKVMHLLNRGMPVELVTSVIEGTPSGNSCENILRFLQETQYCTVFNPHVASTILKDFLLMLYDPEEPLDMFEFETIPFPSEIVIQDFNVEHKLIPFYGRPTQLIFNSAAPDVIQALIHLKVAACSGGKPWYYSETKYKRIGVISGWDLY